MRFVANHFAVEVHEGVVVESRFVGPDAVGVHDDKPAEDEQKRTHVKAGFEEKASVRHGVRIGNR